MDHAQQWSGLPASEPSSQARLRESEERLRAAVDLVGLGCYRFDPLTQAVEWDDRLKAMWGLPPHATVDFATFFSGVHPDDLERVKGSVGQSVDPNGNGICEMEFRVVGLEDGIERWVVTRGKTSFENGRPSAIHGVARDISAQKRLEHAKLLLIAELEHRTRNLLAVVSALADETLESSETLADFVGPFRARLATLSRVQRLLSRGRAQPVMLDELICFELRAQGPCCDGKHVTVSGPEVALPNRTVHVLALALHELATDALAHGALGTEGGHLAVSWWFVTEEDGRWLTLEWLETGIATGAGRAHSLRAGFGRTLIEKSLPFQLDARTQLDVEPARVRCVISMLLATDRP
jgi:PAS domain S-box-containing protein